MYAICVGQKWVTPGEFWSLPPGEIWWLIDAMMPEPGLGESTRNELLEMLDKALAEEAAAKGNA